MKVNLNKYPKFTHSLYLFTPMPLDLQYTHLSEIYCLRPCQNAEATDLIALGGENSVQIIRVTDSSCESIASFRVGTRITALAWSSSTVSPSSNENWMLELVAATADFGLHLLTKSPKESEYIFTFGGGLSGHHGKINDIAFCGGFNGDDSARYVATVSATRTYAPRTDDKMLMVWDLHPSIDIRSPSSSSRPQPTAYVIPFPYPLTSIRSHPTTAKDFLVADCRGSVFLTDWRTDPDEAEEGVMRHFSLNELIEPATLAAACMNEKVPWSASVDWRVDTPDIIGGVYGKKFVVWDIKKLAGGLPYVTGGTFPEGGDTFRWCRTHPDYFAISTRTPAKGAVLHVHNLSYAQASPNPISLRPKPHFIRDFDFLGLPGIPRVAAAVGRDVIIFPIGEDTT
ncbi:hypothetical protein CPC08DRAFT_774271 [Agrocybe pediades]|nr:hypothetical protein CPC08DRAFT_774271 [Agrocybe pediades]